MGFLGAYAQNTLGAKTGLEILKQYATNLLYTLGITEQDKERYPKIEVTGEGTKALYGKRSKRYNSPADEGTIGGALFAGICLLTVGFVILASAGAPVLIGIFLLFGSLATAFGVIAAYSAIPPKEDLAWHENDLAQRYKNYFLSRSSSINKPEATPPMLIASGTNSEVSPTSEPVVSPSAPVSVSTPILTSSSDQKPRGR